LKKQRRQPLLGNGSVNTFQWQSNHAAARTSTHATREELFGGGVLYRIRAEAIYRESILRDELRSSYPVLRQFRGQKCVYIWRTPGTKAVCPLQTHLGVRMFTTRQSMTYRQDKCDEMRSIKQPLSEKERYR
jgi:hypothetical protein